MSPMSSFYFSNLPSLLNSHFLGVKVRGFGLWLVEKKLK
jgi:hypothetical protein